MLRKNAETGELALACVLRGEDERRIIEEAIRSKSRKPN